MLAVNRVISCTAVSNIPPPCTIFALIMFCTFVKSTYTLAFMNYEYDFCTKFILSRITNWLVNFGPAYNMHNTVKPAILWAF